MADNVLIIFQKKEEQRQKELSAFVERFAAKASKARQAQSKAKVIEKLKAQQVDMPQERAVMNLGFKPTERTSDTVFDIKDLGFAYSAEKTIFSGLDLQVRRGDRITISGINGAGKTTLLRLLAEELTPNQGTISPGRHVKVSYFAQHHTHSLLDQRTILEEVWSVMPHKSQTEVRGLCGSFLFTGDDVEKPISVLSGGEKARVALAKMLLDPGNVLLLDEPTNHLDTESADRLTESLNNYDGTLVFVSHSLDFARRLSNKVWDVKPGHLEVYPGSFGEYLDHLEAQHALLESELTGTKSERGPVSQSKAERIAARQEAKRASAELRKKRRKLENSVGELETKISTLEETQQNLESDLASPETHADAKKSKELSQQYQEVTQTLDIAMGDWADQQAELEALPEE